MRLLAPRRGPRPLVESLTTWNTVCFVAQQQQLPDEARVIRGGFSNLGSLRKNARRHYARFGYYALSVFTLPDASIEEIAAEADLPNDVIRPSTVGALRKRGFNPVPKGRPAHAEVRLSDDSVATINRFRGAFEPTQPNPALQGGSNA